MEKIYIFIEEKKKEDKFNKVKMLNMFEVISKLEDLAKFEIKNIIDLTDEQCLLKYKDKLKDKGIILHNVNKIKSVFIDKNVLENLQEKEKERLKAIKTDFFNLLNSIISNIIGTEKIEIENKTESLKLNLKDDITCLEDISILKTVSDILTKAQKI